MNQDKIFAYGSYEEFFNDYFRKQLIAVEDMNRVKQLKDARQRYEKRWNPQRGYGVNLMKGQQIQRRHLNMGGGQHLQKLHEVVPELIP